MTSSPPKNILITGGARGIGRALARHFLRTHNRVFILDINCAELAHVTSQHLQQYSRSGDLSAAECNLRSADDVRAKVKVAAEWFGGRIDVLVNNGGIAPPHWRGGKTMEDWDTLAEWQAYVETNLTAPFVVSQACIPFMKVPGEAAGDDMGRLARGEPGPCIVHIGSFRALQSDPHQEGYASAKAGLRGLLHSMAVSCQPWGIRVNLVAPGLIRAKHESKEGDENGMKWEDGIQEGDKESVVTARPGMPEDIAKAVEYLAGAGFVTGQEIVVDGGATKIKNSV